MLSPTVTPAFAPKGKKGPAAPVIPEDLRSIPGLQFNPSTKQYRDPATDKIYDENGNPI